MGNSTITLQTLCNQLAGMPNISPLANPGSYAVDTLLAIADDVMTDLISARFNFKWNSRLITPFLTNSWQQDYPLAGITDIGWLEEAWWVDINSLTRPIPSEGFEVVRDLPVQNGRWASRPEQLAWMYNQQLQLDTWPGPQVVYAPLLTQGNVAQNPRQAILDANGNILILIGPGTTGNTAPSAPSNSPEGTTMLDGSCRWMVCSPNSQGFRVAPMAPGTGPVYQIHAKYQRKPVPFTSINQTLGVIPDDYAPRFRDGFRVTCYKYSADDNTRDRYEPKRSEWLGSIVAAEKQGDREADAFRIVPASGVVEPFFGIRRDPRDPSRPY